MTARSFCYACAGIFLLVAAWTMGARHARADFDASAGPIVAAYQDIAVRADGTYWRLDGSPPEWHAFPFAEDQSRLPADIAYDDILFFEKSYLYTKDGVGWVGGAGGEWVSAGRIPLPATPIESSTMSNVKGKFREEE